MMTKPIRLKSHRDSHDFLIKHESVDQLYGSDHPPRFNFTTLDSRLRGNDS